MRLVLAAIAVLTLAACGQQEKAADAAPAPEGSVQLGSTQNLPDWLLVARQSGTCSQDEAPCRSGDIHFNQRTITRDSAAGTADIWIQVHYGQQQLYETETETTERVIRFELERVHYRFKCAEEQFTIVERQIMGAGEVVVARDEPTQLYRNLPGVGSVTRLILPIACRGV
jgi:hypothetical protein